MLIYDSLVPSMGILRFILALSVALMHGGDTHLGGVTLVYGFDAVVFFFMISGFYMTLILNGKYIGSFLFYINRALRLYPTYWIVLFVLMVFQPKGYTGPWSTVALFDFFNVTMLFTQFAMLLDCSSPILSFIQKNGSPQDCSAVLYIGPVWSLSVEIIFYAVAPFVVRFGPRYPAKMTIAIVMSLLYLLLAKINGYAEFPFQYNLFFPNMMWFALGSVSYYMHVNGLIYKYLPNSRQTQVLIFAMLIFISLSYAIFPHSTKMDYRVRAGVYAVLLIIGMPYIFSLFSDAKTIAGKIDKFVGDVSYPLYLCHGFVIHELSSRVPAFNAILLTVAVSIGLALVVEQIEPIRRRISWRAQRSPVTGGKFLLPD